MFLPTRVLVLSHLGTSLMESLNLNYVLIGSISKNSHIRGWGFSIGIRVGGRGQKLVYSTR